MTRIFGIPKVSFDFPSESKEQDTIFINISQVISRVTAGVEACRAMGSLSVFANSDKLPFGFFNKKINSADLADTIDLFFYNIDQNAGYYGNLVERKCDFTYFYRDQYDPDHGEITSIVFSEGDN